MNLHTCGHGTFSAPNGGGGMSMYGRKRKQKRFIDARRSCTGVYLPIRRLVHDFRPHSIVELGVKYCEDAMLAMRHGGRLAKRSVPARPGPRCCRVSAAVKGNGHSSRHNVSVMRAPSDAQHLHCAAAQNTDNQCRHARRGPRGPTLMNLCRGVRRRSQQRNTVTPALLAKPRVHHRPTTRDIRDALALHAAHCRVQRYTLACMQRAVRQVHASARVTARRQHRLP
jgi:hypothetical protein